MRRLIDFSRNNRLIYHRELKTGTYALGDLNASPIRSLLAGSKCPFASFQDTDLTSADRAKIREIRLRAKANEEERGLQTLFCALGFATWPAEDGGRPANAPMFLLPVSIVTNERTGELSLKAAGDLAVNRVLLAKLEDDLHVTIHAGEVLNDEGDTDFFDAFRRFSTMLRRVPNLQIATNCVLSNFDFQKMAMVEDLRNNGDLLASNDLVAAISGDEAARAAIAESQRMIDPEEIDRINPHDELFVLDSDSSQQRVIHSFLRHPAHGAIQGPPGTGKSQTIANLIAALIGSGRRVLFVAEKRAALEIVQKRLQQVGLGHLVLDLHGGDVKRKTIYERLRASDDAARKSPAPNGQAIDGKVAKLRDRLNSYCSSVNVVRESCGFSVYQLFAALTRLTDVTTLTRWVGPHVEEFTRARFEEARDLLSQITEHAELFLRNPQVPWASAEFQTPDHAAQALAEVQALRERLDNLRAQCDRIFENDGGVRPTRVSELPTAAERLAITNAAAAALGPDICAENLDELVTILRPARHGSIRHLIALTGCRYRQTWNRMKERCAHRQRTPYEVESLIRRLSEQPAAWRTASLALAATGDLLAEFSKTIREVRSGAARLSTLATIETCDDIGTLEHQLDELHAASRNAYLVASVRYKETRLRELGAASFLRKLSTTTPSAREWVRMFEKAWFQSQLDHAFATDPVLSCFEGSAHRDSLEQFRRLDRARLAEAARRIRRVAAERYINALNSNPGQRSTVYVELNKKTRHMPLRRLMAASPDIVAAITPCIMASPLSVSQLLPAQVLFDVVIFDEASQVLPEDAIPAIIRARHTIVAGDQKQLPPTTFFELTDRDDDHDDAPDVGTVGMESILDLMCGFVEPRPLQWHYRSRDESLIAFSNHHFYRNELLTFPGIGSPQPAVRHVYVPPAGVDGQEQSSSTEVQCVVNLILEHAENHPEESLGVITMGIKHARRIDEALQNARKLRPDLDDFFAESKEESFFVKNLERVQGDERDAIILSVGYGPDRSGKMVYRFGPLLYTGGERRLNVAITRAKNRVTVVSSFRHVDLDPQRLNATGAKLLGSYLQYAETNGANLGREGQVDDIEINEFEADIANALTAEGFLLIPQYGVSNYRIDFAVKHPDKPGQFLLAIECDGSTYHSSPTARDRDRLRQQHLEALGWHFHRIWSTDWFHNRAHEIARAKEAYSRALSRNAERSIRGDTKMDCAGRSEAAPTRTRAGRAPVRRYSAITDYTMDELQQILEWIASDGRLRTNDEMIDEAVREMGFSRKGRRIVEALERAINTMRGDRKQGA